MSMDFKNVDDFHQFFCGVLSSDYVSETEYKEDPHEALTLVNAVCDNYDIRVVCRECDMHAREFKIFLYRVLVGYEVCEADYLNAIRWCGLCIHGEPRVPDTTPPLYERYFLFLTHLLRESVQYIPGKRHCDHSRRSGRREQGGHGSGRREQGGHESGRRKHGRHRHGSGKREA